MEVVKTASRSFPTFDSKLPTCAKRRATNIREETISCLPPPRPEAILMVKAIQSPSSTTACAVACKFTQVPTISVLNTASSIPVAIWRIRIAGNASNYTPTGGKHVPTVLLRGPPIRPDFCFASHQQQLLSWPSPALYCSPGQRRSGWRLSKLHQAVSELSTRNCSLVQSGVLSKSLTKSHF